MPEMYPKEHQKFIPKLLREQVQLSPGVYYGYQETPPPPFLIIPFSLFFLQPFFGQARHKGLYKTGKQKQDSFPLSFFYFPFLDSLFLLVCFYFFPFSSLFSYSPITPSKFFPVFLVFTNSFSLEYIYLVSISLF